MKMVTRKLRGPLEYKTEDRGWDTFIGISEVSNWRAYQAYVLTLDSDRELVRKLVAGERTIEQVYEVLYAHYENLLREMKVALQGHPDEIEAKEGQLYTYLIDGEPANWDTDVVTDITADVSEIAVMSASLRQSDGSTQHLFSDGKRDFLVVTEPKKSAREVMFKKGAAS